MGIHFSQILHLKNGYGRFICIALYCIVVNFDIKYITFPLET